MDGKTTIVELHRLDEHKHAAPENVKLDSDSAAVQL